MKKRVKTKTSKKHIKIIVIAAIIILSLLDVMSETISHSQKKEAASEAAEEAAKNDIKEFETQLSSPVVITTGSGKFDPASIPEYSGEPYAIVNDGMPYFTDNEITNNSYVQPNDLDSLGRCTTAVACLGPETMPADGEERGEIGNVKPTGWCQNKYDCVNGKYVVNRCHMIGWLLSGLNDDERNLITGTRYLNLSMLEFEEMTARYIEETGNHVMYRATPVFKDKELMARGLLLEGYSVEDKGKEICFNLYFYNVQPGIEFDYKTGDNWYTGEFLDTDSPAVVAE